MDERFCRNEEEPLTHDLVMKRVAVWARENEFIRGLVIIGSRARKEKSGDQWSDLDLIVCTWSPDVLLERGEWISRFGSPLLTFTEKTPLGGKERRVLYKNGVDVDFACLSPEEFETLKKKPEVRSLFARGYSVLVDKDRLFSFPEEKKPLPQGRLPSEEDLMQMTNDFLFHAVWTAKKLKRGELWEAMSCCDGYMKSLLLGMIRYYTSLGKETWHSARFVEQWAPPELKSFFTGIFASYGYKEIKSALYNSLDLFSLAGEKAFASLGVSWPEHLFRVTRQLMDDIFGV